MKKNHIGTLVVASTGLASFLIITLVVLVMVNIIAGGMKTFSLQFLTEAPTDGMTSGGIYPAIIGTFLRVLIMTIVGVPIGAITAIYLSEYASSTSVFARMIVSQLIHSQVFRLSYSDCSGLDFLCNLSGREWITCFREMAD